MRIFLRKLYVTQIFFRTSLWEAGATPLYHKKLPSEDHYQHT